MAYSNNTFTAITGATVSGTTSTTSITSTNPNQNLANTLSVTGTTGVWSNSPVEELNQKLVFNINDEIVEFSSTELLYLKEMLTEWILENRPESLL